MHNSLPQFEKGLFIFRRDFRTVDNNGLNLCQSRCKHVLPIFIFTPEQVTNKNDFKSSNAIQFMIGCLRDLRSQTAQSLRTYYGDNNRVIKHIVKACGIDYVCFNADYSPYAITRDKQIVALCAKLGIAVEIAYDYYLHPPDTVTNEQGDIYQKFTPYYTKALKQAVDPPYSVPVTQFVNNPNNDHTYTISLDTAANKFISGHHPNPNLLIKEGRTQGLITLAKSATSQKRYNNTHNDLDKETTLLSAYIKFGCISIREVYQTFKRRFGLHSGLIRQLYWRDFYANILRTYPQVLGHALKPSYNKIKWHSAPNHFDKWTRGQTGFPAVDAGMRQLNATGYMHNRARLIVATFLIKTLLISWQKGEKYFAQKLVDYDPASNNGNWQWCAGSGADSQPYFRIFNPWDQGAHYDPEAKYIHKWIPELATVPPNAVHKWYSACKLPEYSQINYPCPIVDYSSQKEEALKMYKQIFY
jgi:deoxyribodipyrimidine photo-lyase